MGTDHYSLAQRPEALYKWATKSAQKLTEAMKGEFKGLTPVLVYSGLSGISHATALSMALHKRTPHFLFYRRKDGENAHGNERWEHNIPSNTWMKEGDRQERDMFLVFVDDLVSSGSTRHRCFSGIEECMNHDMYSDIKFYCKKYMQLINDVTDRYIRDDYIFKFRNQYVRTDELISA